MVKPTGKHLIPAGGHWIQQEPWAEVNELLLEFLISESSCEFYFRQARHQPHKSDRRVRPGNKFAIPFLAHKLAKANVRSV